MSTLLALFLTLVCSAAWSLAAENPALPMPKQAPGGRPEIIRSFPGISITTNIVRNPTTGNDMNILLIRDPAKAGQRLPALILIPGGNGNSQLFLTGQGTAQQLAGMGFATMVFDPEGRGRSKGREDYGGFKHQDGLAAIVRWAAKQPGVDSERIGLCSNSYGVTFGTGALARYPELPVRFLIDWEGPMDRNDTGGCRPGASGGHLRDVARCDDETFWREREAIKFVGRLKVPYQRIQSERDHVQADNHHAIGMINAALAGGVPEVWLNETLIKKPIDPNKPPAWLPDVQADRNVAAYYARYAAEMFKYSPKPGVKLEKR